MLLSRASFLPEGEERTRIEAELREMEGMVSGTLAYCREGRDAEPAVLVDLAAILQTLADEAADLGHDVRYEGPDHLVLPLRRVAAKRAFQNLLNNALAHGAPRSAWRYGWRGVRWWSRCGTMAPASRRRSGRGSRCPMRALPADAGMTNYASLPRLGGFGGRAPFPTPGSRPCHQTGKTLR